MTTQNNSVPPHLNWVPYKIIDIEIDAERTGFIGRSAAMIIDGEEVIVMTRHDHQLEKVVKAITGDFNPDAVYKTTMLSTMGIEVFVPEQPVEEIPIKLPPAELEVPDAVVDTPVAPPTPGTYMGKPIAEYKTTGAPQAEEVDDPDEL